MSSQPPRKILIALDGSVTSMFALQWYSDWFIKDRDDVQFFHCEEPEPANISLKSSKPGHDSTSSVIPTCAELIEHMHELVGSVPYKSAVLTVPFHKAGEAIVKACEDCKVDILIIGARGHRPHTKRHTVGSTAHYVMQNARLPTIICQLPQDAT